MLTVVFDMHTDYQSANYCQQLLNKQCVHLDHSPYIMTKWFNQFRLEYQIKQRLVQLSRDHILILGPD